MTTLFLGAHYDDEFGAWPLIRRARMAGEPVLFAYLAPPRDPDLRARRRTETENFLASLGVGPEALVAFDQPAAFDGELIRHAPAALEQLAPTLDCHPPDRLVTVAWEGGHSDHDVCAAIAVALGGRWDAPVRQYPLYTGEDLVGPLFHGARTLVQAGPPEILKLSAADWRAYAAAVRFFPSQAGVFSTLWPLMFASFTAHGYRTQALTAKRIRERPHAGSLLYERRGKARYEDLAAVAARLLESHRPAGAGAGGRRP